MTSTIGTTGIWDFYDAETNKYMYSFNGFMSKKNRVKINRMGFAYVLLSTDFRSNVNNDQRVFQAVA